VFDECSGSAVRVGWLLKRKQTVAETEKFQRGGDFPQFGNERGHAAERG